MPSSVTQVDLVTLELSGQMSQNPWFVRPARVPILVLIAVFDRPATNRATTPGWLFRRGRARIRGLGDAKEAARRGIGKSAMDRVGEVAGGLFGLGWPPGERLGGIDEIARQWRAGGGVGWPASVSVVGLAQRGRRYRTSAIFRVSDQESERKRRK